MKKTSRTRIRPLTSLNLLSHREIASMVASNDAVFQVFRNCALAILNTDSNKDDAAEILADFSDFSIEVIPQSRGLMLEVHNAPDIAFVDDTMIRGLQDHLFSALRDIVYTDLRMSGGSRFQLDSSAGITDAVFRILRNAGVVRANRAPNLVICWGGHAISRAEYDYSKEVGFQLGLRGLDVGTGCGIGAMKGPMKGAAVGHAKQQINDGRYVGISEPGIIASESPNAIVNELVIMPDIEKRLEAFVRLAHTIVVFPGGAGTAEEVLYLLSILMHPNNKHSLPLIFAAPETYSDYFAELEEFIASALGKEAAALYQVVIGEPEKVAREVRHSVERVHRKRRHTSEAYYFNWGMHIAMTLQRPFLPTHQNMAALKLDRSMPAFELAANLRAAFSGIVAGNVKAFGIDQINRHGPYQLTGDPSLMSAMDALLRSFVRQRRMKLGEGADEYRPCYAF